MGQARRVLVLGGRVDGMRWGMLGVVGMVMAVGAARVEAAPGAFNVVLLPPIPVLPASVGQTGAVVGTGVQGSIVITDPVPRPIEVPPFFEIQRASDLYSTPMAYMSVTPQGEDTRETSDGRSVSVASTSGHVASTAIASPGMLRGEASAGGGGGSVDGIATATSIFVDTVTLVHGGGYTVNWDVHGVLNGGYSILTPDIRPQTRPGASATIHAQVWWVPHEVNLTQAAQSSFLGCVWQSSTWTLNLETGETVITDDSRYPDFGQYKFNVFEIDGTKFWVVGLLEITASRGSGSGGTVLPSTFVTGTANFMNTVRMTIDSYNFPGEADVISASGHDYSIPRPPCAADFNGDGFLTFEDFDAFVESFEIGESKADFDGDGFITFEDFDAFVVAFEVGC